MTTTPTPDTCAVLTASRPAIADTLADPVAPTNWRRAALAAGGTLLAATLFAASGVAEAAPNAGPGGARTVFLQHAIEHVDATGATVSLPLHTGRTSDGRTVHYVLFESSDGKDAAALGINHAAKLNNARVPADSDVGAVMHVTFENGMVVFPASVTFNVNVALDTPPFLPAARVPLHARGEPGYSPLIQLPDGTIRNAPHIANDSGNHPKVAALDLALGRVRLHETPGFAGGKAVLYVSTDASADIAAALEGATFAPKLNAAPFAGGDGTDSARASLTAFTNGQLGGTERQGLNAAITDGGSPLNVLAWSPQQGRYSPLWDVHLATWTTAAVASGQNLRQTDFGQVRNLAQKRLITDPAGNAFGPAGFIVNCPIVSSD